jgi:superfamily I DNA/RNA helicase
MAEWGEIVDAWQLESWDAYRTVARLGRKTRLPEAQRAILWSIYEIVRAGLAERSLITHSQMFTRLAAATATAKHPPFDFAIIDEAQDLTIQQLRFFAALGAVRSDSASEWDNAAGRGRSGGRSPDASALPVPTPPKDSLFFAGDLGQRIFQTPFSWLSLGVDIRGRSRTLRINYRTSHQIRAQADRLLGLQVADVDGNVEERGDTISVFNGPPPAVVVFDSPDKEAAGVASWIKDYLNSGLEPHEFGVFVRSSDELDRARAAVAAAGVPSKALDESNGSAPGHVSICTMHAAKGLEFRAVVVMACDDEVIPLHSRIESVGDESDLSEVYETERHLLYVACTRARDYLLVTGVAPASEFLDDLRG